MAARQIILKLIIGLTTIISIYFLLISLLSSLNQPQVQEKLETYQTDIILQATEFNFESLLPEKTSSELADWRSTLMGKDPYLTARKQYQEASRAAEKNLKTFQSQFDVINTEPSLYIDGNKQVEKIKKEIDSEQAFLNNLNLKLGIIQVQEGKLDLARKTWQTLINSLPNQKSIQTIKETAEVLISLWSNPPSTLPNAESYIDSNLKSWFRYRALKQLYQIENRQSQLLALQEQEQASAKTALLKLLFLNSIPLVGGALGVAILLFLLIQLAIKKEKSVIALNYNLPWNTPWGGMAIWQVLIIGFFFWGQIILPLLLFFLGNILSLKFTNLSLRGQSIYVLFNYFLLAIGGLSVIYLSIKSYFPLDKDWFRFKWLSNWPAWGIGGYLVALPLVVVISLINQQIWNGQGGSNPLLFLALEARDWFVLAVFFFTASIAAPLYEEIVFRGFLLPSLTRYVPIWVAILISSLIFAIAHQNLSEVLPLLVLGIILGITYTRSRNLLASILLHSLWNSGTLLSLFILGSG